MILWDIANKANQIGLCSAGVPGEIGIWVAGADLSTRGIYRVKVSLSNPEGYLKEAQFSVTWDPAQEASFVQKVRLPETFRNLFESGSPTRALITVTGYGKNRTTLSTTYELKKVEKIYRGDAGIAPKLEPVLPTVEVDAPVIATLDFDELQERKLKLLRLEAEAKAKIKPPAPPPAAPVPPSPAPAGA